MFYKERVENLEATVKRLEEKVTQLECDHETSYFHYDQIPDELGWLMPEWLERCSKCKKVLTIFKNEADCLTAKNKYVLKMVEINKLRISDLGDKGTIK